MVPIATVSLKTNRNTISIIPGIAKSKVTHTTPTDLQCKHCELPNDKLKLFLQAPQRVPCLLLCTLFAAVSDSHLDNLPDLQ